MASSDTHALHAFMAQVTQEMASEYERIFARASEDPGTAGDEGEENWATLFRQWLPPTYHVQTKGRLVGHDGRMSPQIDVLVLKPSYPRKLLEKKVWLADGVAAAFECKTTLTAAHIAESVEKSVEFKSLFHERLGSPAAELRSPLVYGLLAHSHSWRNPGSRPIENVSNAFENAAQSLSHPRLLPDAICVANLATWTPMFVACHRADWLPEPQQSMMKAIFGGDWGVTSAMMCAAYGSEHQSLGFTPIGALIGFITQALARHDPSVRDLADYYRQVDLWGSGAGAQRFWPASIYSSEVREGIEQGRLRTGSAWDEWALAVL